MLTCFREVAQATKAAQTLREDVDAIGGWVQQVITFLHAARAPSELACPIEGELSKEPKVEHRDQKE